MNNDNLFIFEKQNTIENIKETLPLDSIMKVSYLYYILNNI